jgi:hypothetical protein
MDKPVLSSFQTVATMMVQTYERYLPTAFDESMTLLEKLNKVIDYMNSIGKLSNDVVSQWNTVMTWVMADGLTDSVDTKIDSMVTDGTLSNLINLDLLNQKADKSAVALKIDNVVNVKDYGWKGDGVTDDSASIQNAINSLANGGIVIIPFTSSGTYVSSTILLPNNITVMGYNTHLISALKYPVSGGSYPTRLFQNTDLVNGNQNIRLVGLKLDGQYDKGTWVQGTGVGMDNLLRFEHVTGLYFENVEMTNFRNNKDTSASPSPDTFYVLCVRYCDNVKFENVSMTNIVNGEGMYFISTNNIYMNKLYTNNTQCWTPLHMWYCDKITITNSRIIEETDKASTDSSSVNLFCSNVLFKNVLFSGGGGVDIGNELYSNTTFIEDNVIFEDCIFDNYIGLQTNGKGVIKNLKLVRCKFTPANRAISMYGVSIDGMTIMDCEAYASDTTQVAYYFDPRNGVYMHNIKVIRGYVENFDTAVKFYLRQGQGFKNIHIQGLRFKSSPLGAKLSANGSSTGVHIYLYDTDLYAGGGVYFQNINVRDCVFDVEGCPLLVAQATAGETVIDARNIFIENLRGLSSSGVSINRGIQVNGFKNVMIQNCHITDLLSTTNNIASYCTDINLMNNRLSFTSIDSSTRPWRFEHSNGNAIFQFNTLVNTGLTNNHFSQTTATTTFANKIIGNNIPNTADATW